jgi:hypothetical protein
MYRFLLVASSRKMPENQETPVSSSEERKKRRNEETAVETYQSRIKELRLCRLRLHEAYLAETGESKRLEVELKIIRTDVDLVKYSKAKLEFVQETSPRTMAEYQKAVDNLNMELAQSANEELWVRQQIAQMELSKMRPTALRMGLKPDSQRISEILPEGVHVSACCEMFLVNRTDAIQSLLRAHCNMFQRRGGAGQMEKFPLIDSQFGMGKTSFTKSYLALVARDFVPNAEGIWKEELKDFVRELLNARTLYVAFTMNTLTVLDSTGRRNVFLDRIRTALSQSWKIDLRAAGDTDITEFFARFVNEENPLFLVLDEIGRAFSSPKLSIQEQRTIPLH